VEEKVTLKYIREYHQKRAGLALLVAAFCMLIVAGLAVFIVDEATLAGEDSGMSFNIFNFSFIFGAFVFVFMLIAGFYGFRFKTEGSTTLTRFVSVASAFIGLLFTADILWMLINEKNILKDEYTRNIFIIGGVAGAIVVVYSIICFIDTLKSRSFYDRAKAARDIPDVTVGTTKQIYSGFTTVTGAAFSLATAFMSYFMCDQIKEYCEMDLSDVPWQAGAYNVLFTAGIVAGVLLVIMGMLYILSVKLPMKNLINVVLISVSLLIMAAFVVISFTMLGKMCVKAGYPDITYIVFTFVLILFSVLLNISSLRVALPYLKQR